MLKGQFREFLRVADNTENSRPYTTGGHHHATYVFTLGGLLPSLFCLGNLLFIPDGLKFLVAKYKRPVWRMLIGRKAPTCVKLLNLEYSREDAPALQLLLRYVLMREDRY